MGGREGFSEHKVKGKNNKKFFIISNLKFQYFKNRRKPPDKPEKSMPQTWHTKQLLEELLCKSRRKTQTHQQKKINLQRKNKQKNYND